MPHQILLKGGTVLLHDEEDHVVARKADLLICGSEISQIEDFIEPSASMEVIDCSEGLISPGFINTHHHLWQTQFKGIHANDTLLDYFYHGSFPGTFFTPTDIFWGQLSGALESIDAGTTTVVDHANLNHSPEHAMEAVRATLASGIRSVFCYCPTPRVAQWQPTMKLEYDMFPKWVMETFHRLSEMRLFATDGRIKLGFALDGTHLPPNVLMEIFDEARSAGSHLITLHAVHGAMFDASRPSMVKKLAGSAILANDFLLSHANNLPEEDIISIRTAGAHVSSTPLTELQMGHGNPVCFDENVYDIASLGVDCHSACSSSMPTQMMAALQWQRAAYHADQERLGKWTSSNPRTVEDVYNLGTILGARALRLDKQIGSLHLGKKADIVVFNRNSPSMLVAADRDPVAAIVLHSSISDVRTVIVDGVVRKTKGALVDVSVPESLTEAQRSSSPVIQWVDIAQAVRRSREEVDAKIRQHVDPKKAREGVIKGFHLNSAGLCDSKVAE